MLIEALRLALDAIWRNLLRSFLTVLGIVIGVASVIALVTIGEATTAEVSAKMSKLGTNILFIRPDAIGPRHTDTEIKRFKIDDVNAIRDQVLGLRAVAPFDQTGATAIFRGQNHSTTVIGTTDDYLVAQNWELTSGREFLLSEEHGGQTSCLVGATIVKQFFGTLDPVGQQLRIDKISCSIIGVLVGRGQTSSGQDEDDVVLLPISTFQRRFGGTTEIPMMVISIFDGIDGDSIKSKVTDLLRERRHISPGRADDFSIADMSSIMAAFTSTAILLTGLLASIAAVSLFVGGIGIMNMMLVSVTERTREIGVRLAIGALESQVLIQFLVEAIVLSLLGGIVGIVAGLSLAYGVVCVIGIPFVASPSVIIGAFLFSATIGMAFGYFPAMRAAHLNPIDALRNE